MKRIINVLVAVIVCISLTACSFNLSEVEENNSSTIDLTALVIERSVQWLGDYETEVCPTDYIKDLKIKIENKDNESYISQEEYTKFCQDENADVSEFVLAVIKEGLKNAGFDEQKNECTAEEFFQNVTGKTINEYIEEYVGSAEISLEDIEKYYGLEVVSDASVEKSNVVKVGSENEYATNISISVDADSPKQVKALTYFYDNNIYVSLRDLAVLLASTSKAFDVNPLKSGLTINHGANYDPLGNECQGFDTDKIGYMYSSVLKLHDIQIDGNDAKYYTLYIQDGNNYDCFMRLIDAAMVLDLEITQSETKSYAINTDNSFSINTSALEENAFFESVNSVLIGDATSGEIYYSYAENQAYPIASITKLMTYIVVKDAITRGELSEDSYIPFSSNAVKISNSDDGLIPISVGETASVKEMFYGMLLPSSNECAIALAEAVAGSEENFVQLMMEKAEELGLKSAEFYTCNGLPSYTDSITARKMQNYMSTADLFKMITYLLNTYPEIQEITSCKIVNLSSLGVEVKNTNPLVYNMSSITGLKSGSTTRSGICQTASMTYTDLNGDVHNLVAIELGAESSVDRQEYIEILMRLAKQIAEEDQGLSISENRQMPDNANDIIKLLVIKAQKNGYI